MTSDEALEILVVYVAMTDAQLATDCERAIKAALTASQAEVERLGRERDEARRQRDDAIASLSRMCGDA